MNPTQVFIIAELSANHNNNFELTLSTIKAMAEAGANAVKIQTYTAESLSLDINNEFFGPKKEGLWKGYRPYDLYKKASMPYEWQPKLKKFANEIGLVFFSSPFDKEGVDFLERMNVPMYKIASFEINDIPLIEYVASKGKPIIISTGVADKDDISLAIDTCRRVGNNQISLLKCTSEYPASVELANLMTIPDMKNRFGVNIGVSDHTMGSIVPIVSVSLGACIVEKHFILDRKIGGPDSTFSMEPDEFKAMVIAVRETEASLGKVTYELSEKDKGRRRSLFVVQDINAGELITEMNVRSIRPGIGLEPKYLSEILGKRSKVNLSKGMPFKMEFLY